MEVLGISGHPEEEAAARLYYRALGERLEASFRLSTRELAKCAQRILDAQDVLWTPENHQEGTRRALGPYLWILNLRVANWCA